MALLFNNKHRSLQQGVIASTDGSCIIGSISILIDFGDDFLGSRIAGQRSHHLAALTHLLQQLVQ
jgi:hypothetical protein